jgi:hypothetical protein
MNRNGVSGNIDMEQWESTGTKEPKADQLIYTEILNM